MKSVARSLLQRELDAEKARYYWLFPASDITPTQWYPLVLGLNRTEPG